MSGNSVKDAMDAMKGGAVRINGGTITVSCKWCGNPTPRIQEGECALCNELKKLMGLRPAAAVKMLGAHSNVAAQIMDNIGGTQILPKGFPPGMYESFDLSDKETAQEVFIQFGQRLRDSMAMNLLQLLSVIGLAKVENPPEPPKEEGKIIVDG